MSGSTALHPNGEGLTLNITSSTLDQISNIQDITKEGSGVPDLGKRYGCPVCGTTVLCLRPGPGVLQCCSKDMELARMESLPSGD